MPGTAFEHFTQDITRAKALKTHAETLPAASSDLADDIYRASWMMAVGAMDAYFCDAFADVLAKILNAKNLDPNIKLTDKIKSIKLPINTLLQIHGSSSSWRWRNAARDLIEKDNVLSLTKVKDLFNHIMDDTNKLLDKGMMEHWLLKRGAKQRLVGIAPTAYRRLSDKDKNTQKKAMLEKLTQRFTLIIQRRHDCIHNCDRPKVTLLRISSMEVQKTIEDIEFLVTELNQHIDSNLRRHLLSIGCTRTLVRRVGA